MPKSAESIVGENAGHTILAGYAPSIELIKRIKADAVAEYRVQLGNMLDEMITTRRGDYPCDLFCMLCSANVTKSEPHHRSCIIGRAISFYDANEV